MVRQFLQSVIGDLSNNKLLSIATDGAGKMRGKVTGALPSFKIETLPGGYRI